MPLDLNLGAVAAQTLPLTFRPLVEACQVPSLVSREAPRSRLQALLLTRPLAGLSSPRTQREWYKSEGFVGEPSCCRPLCRKEDKPGGEPFAACTTTEEMEVARARCKKALSMGRLSHSACILRLKRWLLAGLNDAELSVQNARSDHVAMGGPGLQAFAEGPSEEEIDEKIRQYTASSL